MEEAAQIKISAKRHCDLPNTAQCYLPAAQQL